jgi:mono/diheme cytochrome c family protein
MRVKWAGWAAMVGAVGAAIAGTVVSVAPVAADPPDASVMRGTQVFQDNCEVCHGPYAQGKVGPPLIPIPAEIASQPVDAIRADLTGLVRGGIPGAMPAFDPSQLSDDDVAALTDWFLYVNKVAPNGTSFYAASAPVQPSQSTDTHTYVAATKHSVSGAFKRFWDAHGGASLLGNPITEEYFGYDETDGHGYAMQLFERGRLEYHPDQAGSANEVMLSPTGSAEEQLRLHFLTSGPGGRPTGGPGGG